MARHVCINVTEVTLNLNGRLVNYTARRSGVGQPISESLQVPFVNAETEEIMTPEEVDSAIVADACAKVNAVAGDVVKIFGGCGREVIYDGPTQP